MVAFVGCLHVDFSLLAQPCSSPLHCELLEGNEAPLHCGHIPCYCVDENKYPLIYRYNHLETYTFLDLKKQCFHEVEQHTAEEIETDTMKSTQLPRFLVSQWQRLKQVSDYWIIPGHPN